MAATTSPKTSSAALRRLAPALAAGLALFCAPALAQDLAATQSLQNLPRERMPAWMAPPSYHYSAEGKADPFQTFVRQPVVESKSPVKGKSTGNPLDDLAVSQIKLTGIIFNSRNPAKSVATVEGLDGKAFLLHVGMQLGRGSARVVDITRDSVKVEETETDFLGKRRTKTDTLKLRADDSVEFKE